LKKAECILNVTSFTNLETTTASSYSYCFVPIPADNMPRVRGFEFWFGDIDLNATLEDETLFDHSNAKSRGPDGT
jgi:hypothetical protein